MVRFRPTRFSRSLALITAILFAVLTLVASGPHHHDAAGGMRVPYGQSTPSASGSTDIGSRPGEAVLQTAGAVRGAVDCPLCDWLTVHFLVAVAIGAAAVPMAARVLCTHSVAATSRCCRRVPHRCLRAPPLFS